MEYVKLTKKLVFSLSFFVFVVVQSPESKIDSLVVLARLAQSGKTDHKTHLCSFLFPRLCTFR